MALLRRACLRALKRGRDPSAPCGATDAALVRPGDVVYLVGELGSLCWTELATTDPVPAGHFYASLFDWALKKQETGAHAYTELWKGPRPVGGMMAIEKERGPMPPTWGVYFRVFDCDAAVARARTLGARVLTGPDDIASVGRYASLADREGATFAVIALAP